MGYMQHAVGQAQVWVVRATVCNVQVNQLVQDFILEDLAHDSL